VAERSFKKEVELLRLGDGQTFEGETILAVTKALLQAGVGYVGGYQGAPVSHLMDVLADAEDILGELGVTFEVGASEATAAAMLATSINYPIRGCVTWKSTVGTNVASDALSNLASAGVTGGAVVLHSRASDAKKNFEQEKLGREWNENIADLFNNYGDMAHEQEEYFQSYAAKRERFAQLITGHLGGESDPRFNPETGRVS
jgi:hypothetical protein